MTCVAARESSGAPRVAAGTAPRSPELTGPGGLQLGGGSPIHRLPTHGKLLAALGYVLCVVATPAGSWGTLLGHALLLALVIGLARQPLAVLARRSAVEIPFLLLAAALPLVAAGPRIDVVGVPLSQVGLVAGGTLAAKATLGVLAAVTLAATTSAADLLAALERLALPRQFVAITGFMARYAGIVSADARNARIARLSRGGPTGRVHELRATAGSVGTLFVRSYERGERVQRAMLARGYTGRMPARHDLLPTEAAASGGRWRTASCALLPLGSLVVLVAGRLW